MSRATRGEPDDPARGQLSHPIGSARLPYGPQPPTPANLSGANLSDADLSGATLWNILWNDKVDLSGANLSGANLSGAKLHQAQLEETIGDKNTQLPPDLKPPAHWGVHTDEQTEGN
jgi:hypothetical protein